MNARIIDLIKDPESIANNDLDLLESEIKKTPYAQSIRSLYLYGIHKHRSDNYQQILSETAAFTTDKKILYQFINKAPVPASPLESKVENARAESPQMPVSPDPNSFNEIISISKPAPKPVYVNGELNRILFEGEEDFLSGESPVIDLETTKESGVIVTQISDQKAPDKISAPPELIKKEVELPSPAPKAEMTDAEDPAKSSEKVTEPIPSSPPKVPTDPDTKVNFHGTEEFLPDVKLGVNKTPTDYKVPTVLPSKHELEMQRLIAEVEAKMKNRKRNAEPEAEPAPTQGLDFSDIQHFTVENNSPVDQRTENFAVKNIDNEEKSLVVKPEPQSPPAPLHEQHTWQPMSVSAAKPDSLIEDSKENQPKNLNSASHQATDHSAALPKDSVPSGEEEAFDISFFTQTATSPETEKADELIRDLKKNVEQAANEEESNVPVFINTWQNWLKIDRNTSKTEEKAAISKDEEKDRVIETFISKEPKISKLKDETDFVVKDRGDNISHLMTETLAKLYTEQKLYAKAIKAYQILSEKHPEKKSYFQEQIQAVKDLRQSKQS